MTYLLIFAPLIAAGLAALVLWRDMSSRVQILQKRLDDLEQESDTTTEGITDPSQSS